MGAIIAATLFAADMLGRYDAVQPLDAADVRDLALFAAPVVKVSSARTWKSPRIVKSAIEFLQQKKLMTPEEFEALVDQYRSAGFKIAGVTQDAALAAARDAVVQGIKAKVEKERIGTMVQKALVNAGFDPLRSWHAELVAQMNVASGYGRGSWEILADERTAEKFPAWEYVTMDDGKVRPAHAAMHGFTAARDSPVWRVWWPPCGYGCRCRVRGVLAENWNGRSDRQPVLDGKKVQPDKGFAGNPGAYVREMALRDANKRVNRAGLAARDLPRGYKPPPGKRVIASFMEG